MPFEPIPVYIARDLPLFPHKNHIQLPEECETSESEADEEILQLTLGVENCRIEFQEKFPVTEAEFLSMPFDPHGRVPSTKWPPEKSIGYEAFAKKMAKLHPNSKEPIAEQQAQDAQPVADPLATGTSGQFSTGQYARKVGTPARGNPRINRVRVSKTT